MWNLLTGASYGTLNEGGRLRLSPDGHLLVYGFNFVHAYDLTNGRELYVLGTAEVGDDEFALSHDGKVLAIASRSSNEVTIRDAETSKVIKTLSGACIFPNWCFMEFSLDDRLLITEEVEPNSNGPSFLNIWDVAHGELQYSLRQDLNEITFQDRVPFVGPQNTFVTREGDILKFWTLTSTQN